MKMKQIELNRQNKILVIENLLEEGYSQVEVAKLMGISRQRVNQLLNEQKHQARKAVRLAIKSGKLLRPDICSNCKLRKKIEGHHPDHNDALAVLWLCRDCHMYLHQGAKTKRYAKKKQWVMVTIEDENGGREVSQEELSEWLKQ